MMLLLPEGIVDTLTHKEKFNVFFFILCNFIVSKGKFGFTGT